MPRKVTGVDVDGGRAVFLEGHVQGNGFTVTRYACESEAAADVAAAWDAAEPGFAPKRAVVGLTGREVNLRFSRVPRLADWQLKKLMRFEVANVGDRSESDVAADFNVLPELPELEGEDVVLLAMARESLLAEHMDGLADHGGALSSFTPSAIALYNAWLRFGVVMDDTVMLAYLGREHSEVIVVRGADLVFARNLSGGAAGFEQAVAERFGVDRAKAGAYLRKVCDLTPGASFRDADHERATRAVAGAAGQVQGLLQSTLQFAKSQVKLSSLKLDRVFVCGELAELRGIDRYLQAGLGATVERFDPFQVVDVSKLSAEEQAALERTKLRAVLALGLATQGSDPEAYSIEILPEKLAKRREFAGGTLFLILAGLLAFGYLAYDWQRKGAALELVEGRVSKISREVRLAEGVHADAQELVRENEALHESTTELMHLAASGEQLARALTVLDRHLPFGFWISGLALDEVSDPDFGFAQGSAAPVLEVEGRASEGIEPNSVLFQRLVEALRTDLPRMRVREGMSPDGSRYTLRFTLVGSDPEPESDGDDEADLP